MPIQPGDKLPVAPIKRVDQASFEDTDTGTLFAGRDVVLFAVPGAFTPTCSERHLPGFVAHYQAFRDKGVDVACMSVNDAFVMQAWGQMQQVPDGLWMLSDGNADFTRALGLEMDASGYGMGMRSKRFALHAVDGVVKQIFVEAPGEFRVSSAEYVLEQLDRPS